jgi:hypothetical protein
VAQTALISRLTIASLVLVFAAVVIGQEPNNLGDILDKLPAETVLQGTSTGSSLDPLRLLDSLDTQGRHRFVFPLPRTEAGPATQRLRETLKDLQILDAISASLEAKIQEATSLADQAAARGEIGLSKRLRGNAQGLWSVLESNRYRPGNKRSESDWPGDNIRVARATEPYPLLAWNSGAYSIANTPHFSIASQAGDRPTADMAQACELAHEIWSQLFAWRLISEQVDTPKSDSTSRREPFRVVMFRTRDAYVKALRAIEPKIGISTGYYSPRHRISFFYWDGPKSLPTLVHELTHQFFQEWTGREPSFNSDRDPGFWAIEGVALYLESFSMQKIGGAVIVDVGGWDSPRLQMGRYRRLHDEYWIAWEEFSRLDGNTFRNSKDIPAWYSQACGLVHRWLDGSEEEFQQFTGYLIEVYDGKGAKAALTLAQDNDAMLSGYDNYLLTSWNSTRESNARPFFTNRREAVLSRCEVTSRDLLAWPSETREMDWLDLSFSKVDDRWLTEAGERPWRIARLNLESTAATDASLASIATMKELKELDLSHCKVTDEGLAALRGHPNLRQLWLDQTQITDASIDLLLSLPKLERLSIEGSGISDQGKKTIFTKKPYLKR